MQIWRRNHGTEQPSSLVFVQVVCQRMEASTTYAYGSETLRLWHSHLCRWADGSTATVREAKGRWADEWWETLADHCWPKMVTWVFGHDLMRTLWLLQFPERVESGDIEITRQRRISRSRDGSNGRPSRPWRGLCSIDRGNIIIHAIRKGKRINFVDLHNYYRGPLDEIGRSVGVVMPPEPYPEQSDELHHDYCRAATMATATAIKGLLTEWKVSDLGNWQPTIASLAHSAYRHRFMPIPIVCHGDDEASSMERDAYYDGRVQAYYLGDVRDPVAGGTVFGSDNVQSRRPWLDGPVSHYDANALYPSVMRAGLYPCRAITREGDKPAVWANETPSLLAQSLQTYLSVASVTLETDKDWYPTRYRGETVYPIGRFTTTLCTPELNLALAHEHIVRVNWAIYYIGARLFTDWVDYWWGRRRMHESNGNHVAAAVAKIAVNSLVGKLAQRDRYWTNSTAITPPESWQSWVEHDADRGTTIKCRSIGWSPQVMHDAGYSPHAFVAVAAHVNSYARVRMHYMRMSCLPDQVYYIANDGLIVSADGAKRLQDAGWVNDGELGSLRLEGVHQAARFWGPRDYEEDGAVRKSGLPKGSVRIGDRHWACQLAEDAASLLARPPDSSVRTMYLELHGSDGRQPGCKVVDGWTRPIVLRGRKK